MSLFPKQKPFQIRNAYVEVGEIVHCENCYRILTPGTSYDPSRPRCSRCFFV